MSIFNKKTIKDDKEEKQTVAPVKDVKKDEVKKEKKDDKKSMKELYSDSNVKKDSTGKEIKNDKKFDQAYRILVKPLITEKAASMNAEGKYVFEIGVDANKISVAKAIEAVYGIKPVSVNVINMKGKKVRTGRYHGKRKDWRKAIIALPKGKSIQVYEGV